MRLPMSYEFFRTIYIGKVVILVAAIGWVFSPRLPVADRSPIRSIDIAMGGLVVGAFFSMLFSEHVDLAWNGYVDLLKWGITYFLISRTLVSTWRLKVSIFIMLLLNLKLAQAAIRYFYNTRSFYDEVAAVREGARAGSTGFFSNSADFGLAMCVVWPIAFMLLFAKMKGLWRILLIACSVVFLVAIIICGSRGALVGGVCIVIVGVIATGKKRAALVMALLMLPGILYLLPGASKERFRSAWELEGDVTAQSRLTFWKAGLRMFAEDPILGVGIKNFPITRLKRHADMGETTRAWVPHSLYIEVLSELGLAGTLPGMSLFVLLFIINSRTRKHLLTLGPDQRTSFEYCLSWGLVLGTVGYMTAGAFIAVFYYPHLWVLLGLSTGLYVAAARKTVSFAPVPTIPGDLPWDQAPPRKD